MNTTRHATKREMMNYETLLVSANGDQLWRFTDDYNGKPRFKVFAMEPKKRTQIKNWEGSVAGADYFLGGKYIATDYIIPKKYLNRTVALLGMDLRNNPPRERTEKQKAAFAKFRAARANKSQVAMEFVSTIKVA
jgi:hypothetical protein